MRRSKYGNTRTEFDGHIYDSALEAKWAANFNLLKRSGQILEWERQYTVELDIYDRVGNLALSLFHRVDFRIILNDGCYSLVEIKGFETAEWKLRKKLLNALWLPAHPDYCYQVIKKGGGFSPPVA